MKGISYSNCDKTDSKVSRRLTAEFSVRHQKRYQVLVVPLVYDEAVNEADDALTIC